MDCWELRDAFGNKIGRTIEAGTPLPEGTHRLVVDVWVKAADGKWLMRHPVSEEADSREPAANRVETDSMDQADTRLGAGPRSLLHPGNAEKARWEAICGDVRLGEDAMRAAARTLVEVRGPGGDEGRFERLFRSLRGACVVEVMCLHDGNRVQSEARVHGTATAGELPDARKTYHAWMSFDEIVALADRDELLDYGDNYLTCIRMGRPMLRSARSRNGFPGAGNARTDD